MSMIVLCPTASLHPGSGRSCCQSTSTSEPAQGASTASRSPVVNLQCMALKIPFEKYTANQTQERSLEEASSELQREIAVRRRVYDRWVQDGKLSWQDAHDRMERMLAALQFLLGIRPLQAIEEPAQENASEKPS